MSCALTETYVLICSVGNILDIVPSGRAHRICAHRDRLVQAHDGPDVSRGLYVSLCIPAFAGTGLLIASLLLPQRTSSRRDRARIVLAFQSFASHPIPPHLYAAQKSWS